MKVFISYRRKDTRAIVGRVYDRLVKEFGRKNVFLDIDAIPAGVDFRQHLQEVLEQCDVVVAVIGHHWMRRDANGNIVWKQDDFIYQEMKSSLEKDLILIPLLVDKAEMPRKADLPEELHDLPYLNAVNLNIEQRFHTDMDFLARELKARKKRRFGWGNVALPLLLISAVALGGKYAYDNRELFGQMTQSDSQQSEPIKTQSTNFAAIENKQQETKVEKVEPEPEVPEEPPEPPIEQVLGDSSVGTNDPDRLIFTKNVKLVRIPAGEFVMGDNNSRPDNEKPAHKVTIKYPFWMSETEITFDQYDYYAELTGTKKPDDEGWGRADRPVINVSWNDTQAYLKWFNEEHEVKETLGMECRLPSEAEWEYAARAGTKTAYSWGNNIGKNNANCIDCGSQWDDKQTAPVASFKPNIFGLYDMHGNVWELVQDPEHYNYKGAPSDGSVWKSSRDSSIHMLRGGSWNSVPGELRSAVRVIDVSIKGYFTSGFRIVCSLPSDY